ncbi:DUF6882 domain-containing protein [Actinoallomurus iriomotensis]|uniref:Uncharacterized protein n=1 Tax=Actinoallomurus iriomotensis TaxID=478107 RepID=A0A9W6RN61_9ACTN|nr:DUF6882 domain-containing protein [Actinoallomurus iriomotensis]GLY78961.1 hypothetical protein Airi01_072280 [Actinoallomurus iriomotensis]
MDLFSDALLDLARPHLGWAAEQLGAFHSVVPAGAVGYDADARTARMGDLELRADLLGTYAEDATFQWGWAKSGLAGMPAISGPLELRRIGERHGVPELTTEMVDLRGVADSRLAAQRLGLIAMALLGARGAIDFCHGGRSLTFLVTDDPALPASRPDPATVGEALRTGAQMLPGTNAAEVVSGYAAHHGLTMRDVPEGLELDLPGDHRVLVHLDGERLGEVVVTGPDGPVAAAPLPPAPAADGAVAAFFPPSLLTELARGAAEGLDRGAVAFGDHLEKLGWPDRTPSSWEAGVVHFGDVFSAEAYEIGVYHHDTRTWHWGDGDGVARLRAIAREHGADHLAADQVVLPDAPGFEGYIVVLLVRAATQLGRARGLASVPTEDDGKRYWAVTDSRVPEPASSLPLICEVILSMADCLQQLTPQRDRYATMRAMVLGYFDAYGITPLYVGEPELLIGTRGPREVRVEFSHDGTINRAYSGLQGTLG